MPLKRGEDYLAYSVKPEQEISIAFAALRPYLAKKPVRKEPSAGLAPAAKGPARSQPPADEDGFIPLSSIPSKK